MGGATVLIAFVVASAVLIALPQLASAGAAVLVARLAGVAVTEVEIGFGPRVWSWQLGGQTWRLKLLPIGTAIKFRAHAEEGKEDDSEPPLPGSFLAAPLPARLLILIAGPFAQMLIGAALTGAAIAAAAPQLAAARPGEAGGVPLLIRGTASTSLDGQARLFADTIGDYLVRLASFRSLDGRGGQLSYIVAACRAGADSPIDWLTLMGLGALTAGGLNLLPLSPMMGYQALSAILGAVIDRRHLPEPVDTWAAVVGLLACCIYYGRVWLLDASSLLS